MGIRRAHIPAESGSWREGWCLIYGILGITGNDRSFLLGKQRREQCKFSHVVKPSALSLPVSFRESPGL